MERVSDYLEQEDTVVGPTSASPTRMTCRRSRTSSASTRSPSRTRSRGTSGPRSTATPPTSSSTAYATAIAGDGELRPAKVSAFVLPRALVTVRQDAVVRHRAGGPAPGTTTPELIRVRRRGAAAQPARRHRGQPLRRRAGLGRRRSRSSRTACSTTSRPARSAAPHLPAPQGAGALRRVILPMRDVVGVAAAPPGAGTARPERLYHDLYDHVLRATEWTESSATWSPPSSRPTCPCRTPG